MKDNISRLEDVKILMIGKHLAGYLFYISVVLGKKLLEWNFVLNNGLLKECVLRRWNSGVLMQTPKEYLTWE